MTEKFVIVMSNSTNDPRAEATDPVKAEALAGRTHSSSNGDDNPLAKIAMISAIVTAKTTFSLTARCRGS